MLIGLKNNFLPACTGGEMRHWISKGDEALQHLSSQKDRPPRHGGHYLNHLTVIKVQLNNQKITSTALLKTIMRSHQQCIHHDEVMLTHLLTAFNFIKLHDQEQIIL